MALIEGNDPYGRAHIDYQASATAASQMPYAGGHVGSDSYPASWANGGAPMIPPPGHAIEPYPTPGGTPYGGHAGSGSYPAGGGGGGFDQPPPNWRDILENDPGWLSAKGLGDKQLSTAAASRDAALKALEYAFRGDPNYSTMAQYTRNMGQSNSEYTRNLGNENSQYGYQTANDKADSARALGLAMRALAGRNALTSGEKGWAEEDNATGLQRALHELDYGHTNALHDLSFSHDNQLYGLNLDKFNASRQFSDANAAELGRYTQTADQVAENEQQAISQAAQALMANPLYQQYIPDIAAFVRHPR